MLITLVGYDVEVMRKFSYSDPYLSGGNILLRVIGHFKVDFRYA